MIIYDCLGGGKELFPKAEKALEDFLFKYEPPRLITYSKDQTLYIYNILVKDDLGVDIEKEILFFYRKYPEDGFIRIWVDLEEDSKEAACILSELDELQEEIREED